MGWETTSEEACPGPRSLGARSQSLFKYTSHNRRLSSLDAFMSVFGSSRGIGFSPNEVLFRGWPMSTTSHITTPHHSVSHSKRSNVRKYVSAKKNFRSRT